MGSTLKKIRNTNSISARKVMWISLAGFLMLSILGAVVFLASGCITSPASAFFESVSAFTTTGTSFLGTGSSIPVWIIIFRSLWQWFGGAASLLLFACLLSESELWSPVINSFYHVGIRFKTTVKRLLITYLILTAAEFLLLAATGYGIADSLCAACSTVSTGGASLSNALSGLSETTVFIFMILTMISYPLYYYAVSGHKEKLVRNSELKAIIWIILGGCVLVSASLLISGTYGFGDSVEYGFFHTVSSLSTTGFQISDISRWPSFAKTMLTLLSFIGGSSLSAASGIKIIRFVLIIKILSRSFTVRIHPKAIVTATINGKQLPRTTASAIASFFLTYFAIYMLGVFVISFEAPNFISCFDLSAAFINNVGTWAAEGVSIASFSPVMHVLMAFLMLAGRLELYAVLIPFSRDK